MNCVTRFRFTVRSIEQLQACSPMRPAKAGGERYRDSGLAPVSVEGGRAQDFLAALHVQGHQAGDAPGRVSRDASPPMPAGSPLKPGGSWTGGIDLQEGADPGAQFANPCKLREGLSGGLREGA